MTDFQLFQSEFIAWQERFGLTGYRVYFREELLDDKLASVSADMKTMAVMVTLNSEPEARQFNDVEYTAKHEAIHLLLLKLEYMGKERYTSEDVIDRESEELVHKLHALIPDRR